MNLRTVVIMGIVAGALLCWLAWSLANTALITIGSGG